MCWGACCPPVFRGVITPAPPGYCATRFVASPLEVEPRNKLRPRFVPGPTESAEVLRLDLGDFSLISKPGSYRVELSSESLRGEEASPACLPERSRSLRDSERDPPVQNHFFRRT